MGKKMCLLLVLNMVLNFVSGCLLNDSVKKDAVLRKQSMKNDDGAILCVLTEEASAHSEDYGVDSFEGLAVNSVKIISKGKKDILHLSIEKEKIQEAIDNLSERKDIYSVCEDFEMELSSTYDPSFTHNTNEYAFTKLKISEAWEYETGDRNVKVGVVDTGIDYNHPDLSGKVSQSLSRYFYDGNIYVDSQPTDSYDHGTGVAGIIGAISNNGIGIAGVCKDVTLVSLKVNEEGSPKAGDVINAVNYANNNEIPILNMSFCWPYNHSNFASNKEVLKTALDNYYGLVVCAAGNNTSNMDTGVTYFPACFDLNNVVAVASSDSYDNYASTTNYGDVSVDLFAPGVNVYALRSTSVTNVVYSTVSGTSYAAPYVSGVAALLLANNSSLSPSKIKEILMGSVDYRAILDSRCVSNGRLNAYKALYAINHTHTYSYSNVDSSCHLKSCNNCYYSVREPHNWVSNQSLEIDEIAPLYVPGYTCYYCGATTMFPQV